MINKDIYKIDFCKLENAEELLQLYKELQQLGFDMNIKVVETDDDKIKNNSFLSQKLTKIHSKIEDDDIQQDQIQTKD